MIKNALLSTAERVDQWLPPIGRSPETAAKRLIVLLVHSLHDRIDTAETCGVFPHERMTVQHLQRFLELFLEMGYQFVSPAEALRPAVLPSRAAMLTFDDGYFSFVRALPLLHQYQVPATLFVCPGCVTERRLFWWDAYYRAARAAGLGESKIRRHLGALRKRSFAEIRTFISHRFRASAFDIVDDADRPLLVDELKDLARDPWVHLGNHTFNHVALPFQTTAAIHRELLLAHSFIEDELHTQVDCLAYPNGDYSSDCISAGERLGYRLGMTIEPRWNLLEPQAAEQPLMTLGRYMLAGDREVGRQANSVNRSLSLSSSLRRWKKHRY